MKIIFISAKAAGQVYSLDIKEEKLKEQVPVEELWQDLHVAEGETDEV